MIILYKGARGRGKTLSMVKDGYLYSKEGFKVLRNFHCSFGKYISNDKILELSSSSDIYNCIIMIDEVQIFFDSRTSMKNSNISFSNFVQQIRKRGIIVLCTTQYSNTIDLRLRQHLDLIAFPNYIKNLEVCEVSYIDLTRIEDNDLIVGNLTKPKVLKVVFNAKPIFKMYDTNEVIIKQSNKKEKKH